MTTVFIATSNKGKQAEIAKYAAHYGKDITLRFPDETNKLDVEESGTTFEENALLKASAYKKLLNDDSIIFVGDDSGLKIPALNNEPGVFTKRWAGHEMTDSEIRAYCMEKMSKLTGDQRKAALVGVLAVLKGTSEPRYFKGIMPGRILEKAPENIVPPEGFPFSSIFWVDEVDRLIHEVHSLPPEERGGFLTHREMAFKQLFESLSV